MAKTEKKLKKRTLEGEVVKVSSKNTIKVKIEQKFPHIKYSKIIKKHKTYMVNYNEEKQPVTIGQKVVIGESKPVSKNKRWELIEVVK